MLNFLSKLCILPWLGKILEHGVQITGKCIGELKKLKTFPQVLISPKAAFFSKICPTHQQNRGGREETMMVTGMFNHYAECLETIVNLNGYIFGTYYHFHFLAEIIFTGNLAYNNNLLFPQYQNFFSMLQHTKLFNWRVTLI